MAAIGIEGDEVVLRLGAVERLEGVHSDLRASLASLRSVEVLDDALGAVRGCRMPGTSIPGVVAVGTFVEKGTRIFAVVHHATTRGVRLRFDGSTYDEWIVGLDDPDDVVATLAAR